MDGFIRRVFEWCRRGILGTWTASIVWGHRAEGGRVWAVNIVWGEACSLARAAGPWIPAPAG